MNGIPGLTRPLAAAGKRIDHWDDTGGRLRVSASSSVTWSICPKCTRLGRFGALTTSRFRNTSTRHGIARGPRQAFVVGAKALAGCGDWCIARRSHRCLCWQHCLQECRGRRTKLRSYVGRGDDEFCAGRCASSDPVCSFEHSEVAHYTCEGVRESKRCTTAIVIRALRDGGDQKYPSAGAPGSMTGSLSQQLRGGTRLG
jgi:hypothetical protein